MALLSYQEEPCDRLTKILSEKGSALDASDTGVGKTYCAVHAAKRLGIPVGIICPKSVIPSWQRVCKSEGLEPAFIMNYEKAIRGGTDFILRENRKFVWNFAGLVIWDEVQRCKSNTSLNSQMLICAWETRLIRCLCLSATAFQNPTEMRALGFVLGLHKNYDFWQFCFKNGGRRDRWGGVTWRGTQAQLEPIHKHIFPERGVRVRIKDLPADVFPTNKIIAEPLQIDKPGELDKIYHEAEAELELLREKEENDYKSAFTIILRARQRAELLKVPLLVEMTQDLLEEGKSIVVFCCFNATLELLAQYLNTDCIIKEQDAKQRQENIDRFQSGASRTILCNIQAGGVGLSLHDTVGTNPRVVFHCPTYSAVDLRQALGRAYRAGGKSPVLQRLIYAAGTVEEKVCARVQQKLNNIDLLNDSEISPLIWQKNSTHNLAPVV